MLATVDFGSKKKILDNTNGLSSKSIENRPCACAVKRHGQTVTLNIHNSLCATSVNTYGVFVVRSSLLAKWLREWVIGIGLWLGLGPGNANLSYKMW